ncbi:sulfurtransferase [Lysobacter sp. CA199]|uniref:sulfurtransferase n=1 Tax=Lysobacter sp. CA199 TaxID=3455608 RepID=UPI003F8D5698
MTAWTTLVSAEDLAAALGREDLIAIDTRTSLTDRAASENAYRQSHIPGARYADLDRDLSDHRKTVGGRHPWPDAADFTATLGRWGITPQHQVVIYDAADGALAASRLWFLLRVLGHRRVAVLDGGWQRWTALGLPTDAEIPQPQPTRYDASFDARRLLDAQDVRALLDSGGLLIDARAGERFRGEVEPLDRVAGHVPGASNRAYSNNLADGRFKPADALAAEFAPLLSGRDTGQVAVMCGSGVTACHHLLAMAHAGFDGAALYTGSWSGWIEDPRRPVATGDA